MFRCLMLLDDYVLRAFRCSMLPRQIFDFFAAAGRYAA